MKIKKLIDQVSGVSKKERMATMLQMHALAHLKKHPQKHVSELASECLMSSSAVAQLIDRLASAGWIARDNDPKDHRAIRLSLTFKGEKALKQMQCRMFEEMGRLFSYVSEKDMKEMVRIQTNLLKNLEERK